jgi:hypothetical protein
MRHGPAIAALSVDRQGRFVTRHGLLMSALMPSEEAEAPKGVALSTRIQEAASDGQRFLQGLVGFLKASKLGQQIAPPQTGRSPGWRLVMAPENRKDLFEHGFLAFTPSERIGQTLLFQ